MVLTPEYLCFAALCFQSWRVPRANNKLEFWGPVIAGSELSFITCILQFGGQGQSGQS